MCAVVFCVCLSWDIAVCVCLCVLLVYTFNVCLRVCRRMRVVVSTDLQRDCMGDASAHRATQGQVVAKATGSLND